MKMFEEIKKMKKEYVYKQYTRIIRDFEDYDKITREKMLKAIYDKYQDYQFLIDICTVRELKYLDMLVNGDETLKKELQSENANGRFESKYYWEIDALLGKFILVYNLKNYVIPEEVYDCIVEALKHVNWSKHKKIDDINEVLVGYAKVQGAIDCPTLALSGSTMLDKSIEYIVNHILDNPLFNYYVVFDQINDVDLRDTYVTIHDDFYEISDAIFEERKKQNSNSLFNRRSLDAKFYRKYFYHDMDTSNKKINKFVNELKKLPFLWTDALKFVREYAMLNIDHEALRNAIRDVPILEDYDLTDLIKLMDEAMDEMPSGVLYGLTPNEVKALKIEDIKDEYQRERDFIMQRNACLSKKDAKLFYKIYFGLLDFTNTKYSIKPNLKIYNQQGLDPYELNDIAEKLWEEKDAIIVEFCELNPFKFNGTELGIVSEFKKGIREDFIIVKYEEEYAGFLGDGKIYMVKGINANIDQVIPYENLPYPVKTTILPFKNFLIYDGIMVGTGVVLGKNIVKNVEKEYQERMKYYHL